ncbi:hypothetical protein E4H04_02910 [Candidatus Bathyarchaeota archaeon]|nr:MAG: hypothetical protein E4H04_02910 [Candidatus Bathyarchaeota archaeon]
MQKHTSLNSYNPNPAPDDIPSGEELSVEIFEDYKIEVCRYDPSGSPCSDCRKKDFQQYLACKRAVDLLERIDIANSLKNE